jgi:hypothetical protein
MALNVVFWISGYEAYLQWLVLRDLEKIYGKR